MIRSYKEQSHHTVKDNEIIWFQYGVLNKRLGTSKLRFAMQSVSDQCRLCQSHEESLTHLLFLCEKTKKNLSKFIKNKIKFKIPLDILTVITGY